MENYNLGKRIALTSSILLASCASTPETEHERMEKVAEYGAQQMDCVHNVYQSHLEAGIELTSGELINKAGKVCDRQDLVALIAGGAGVVIDGVLIYNVTKSDGGSSSGGRTSGLSNGDTRTGGTIVR